MNKKDRQIIFDKCGGRCAYCGCELNDKWQVDHAISKCYWYMVSTTSMTAVNNMDNLMPACRECNHYKRSHCVDSFHTHVGFRDYMRKFHLRLAKLPKKTMVEKTRKRILYMYTIANKYGIAPDKPFNGIFYFETLKKSA